MADKRIYEITDQQINYAEQILVAVESATGFSTGTKKMAITAIYEKINQHPLANSIDLNSWLMRVAAQDTEMKILLSSIIDEFIDSYMHGIFSAAGGYDGAGYLYLEKIGKLVNGYLYSSIYTTTSSLELAYAENGGSSGPIFEIPELWRPRKQFTCQLKLSGNYNVFQLKENGTAEFLLNRPEGLMISYITN